MYSINEKKKLIEIVISSEFSHIDRVLDDVSLFINSNGKESKLDDLRLALREVINNAIEHGNHNKKSKKVNIICERIDSYYYKFKVKDEGSGYDTKNINYQMPISPEELRSRGLPLINQTAEKIEFNEKGNEISFYYKLSIESSVEIFIENDDFREITIVPDQNITSSTSNLIKKQLMDIVEKRPEKVIIDFINVREFDSIGLSLIAIFGRKIKDNNSNATITIKNARMEIVQLFLYTGLDKYFILF